MDEHRTIVFLLLVWLFGLVPFLEWFPVSIVLANTTFKVFIFFVCFASAPWQTVVLKAPSPGGEVWEGDFV
jgi:hypothetical protein